MIWGFLLILLEIRIKKLSIEKIEAGNISLLTEIKCNEKLLKCNNIKNTVNELFKKRIDLNLKLKDKNTYYNVKVMLKNEKIVLLQEIR